MVSKNTGVENPDIVKAFQAFHGFAVPASCEATPMGPGNQTYMGALVSLQVGVDRIAGAPNPDAEKLTESDAAKGAAMATAQQHNMGPKPSQLLKDPIIYAEGLAKGVPAAALNGKGGGFSLTGEYLELTPCRRIVHVERMHLPETTPDNHVVTTFEQEGEGTLMTLRMTLPNEAARKAMLASGMEGGMERSYERLEEVLQAHRALRRGRP